MEAEDRYDSLIRYYSEKYGRDPWQIKRQIRMESAFNPNARSGAGCVGLAQFGALTWTEWRDGTAGVQAPPADLILLDPRDPEDAIMGMCAYMQALEKTFGRLDLALAAYNWGPGNVRKLLNSVTAGTSWRERLPVETQKYLLKGLDYQKEKMTC